MTDLLKMSKFGKLLGLQGQILSSNIVQTLRNARAGMFDPVHYWLCLGLVEFEFNSLDLDLI